MIKINRVWGHYYEFLMGNRIAFRLIHYDYMASTSLHRHSKGEFLFGLSGSISIERGHSIEQLYIQKLLPYRIANIKANEWHRMSSTSNKRVSIALEITKVSDIERALPAKPPVET